MESPNLDLESADTVTSRHSPGLEISGSSGSSRPHVPNLDISRHPTQLSREYPERLQYTETVGSSPGSRSESNDDRPLPSFGGGKPYPPGIPAEREAYVVEFDGPEDPLHPLNWSAKKKFVTAAIGALACFCSSFASAVLSAATHRIAEYFHISVEGASLSSSLYLLGYGVGPVMWAPLSELRGRRLPLLLGLFGFSVFAAATAVSKDVQTLMICRFFMGLFGSSPIVLVAAVYSDMYRAEQRGLALTIFAVSVFMGPMVGPIVGSFTVVSYLDWRWDAYWSMIMGLTTTVLIVLFLEETYPATVLTTKAELLRRRTKNWAIHAKLEEVEIDVKELVEKNLARPVKMFFTEPILLLVGFYLSFVYGLMYVTLSAFPLVFEGVHGMQPGVASLPFLGMALGMVGAGAASISLNQGWVRRYHANSNRAVPEWRLPLAAVGGVAFSVGLFWFGWAGAYKSVHWIVPTIAGVVIGFGLLSIFMQLIMYIVDGYLMFAASAIAGNTMVRSLFAAACPLFDRQMFLDMKIQYAATLLGCVAALLVPVPVFFYVYGPKLRQKSKWAPTFPQPHPNNTEHERKESAENTERTCVAFKPRLFSHQ
ncbi:putative MFS multidrug transporter [Exophiala viscosa]|uniref:putative MFS multidrug transporter n=1 Tax=Exophiala viscosa TaxID=2486360 RepID=UPI00219DBCC1|nr:putative MFS multidrug transporter [Exophiala viscosa]